jgi:hypothetical protein
MKSHMGYWILQIGTGFSSSLSRLLASKFCSSHGTAILIKAEAGAAQCSEAERERER